MLNLKKLTAVLSCGAVLLSAAEWNSPALTPVKIKIDQKAPGTVVFQNGKSRYVLVIPSSREDKAFAWIPHVQAFFRNAPEYRKGIAGFAADELQKLIQKCGKVKLQVVRSDQYQRSMGLPFFVGMSSAARKYGFDNRDIPAGGFKVEVKNGAVAILNAPYPSKPASRWDGAYALCHGVYDFAERFMACRFYYPGDGCITPQRKQLVLPGKLSYADAPRFSYRNMYSWYDARIPGVKRMDPMKMALRYRVGGHGALAVKPPQDSSWPDPVGHWKMAPAVDARGKRIMTRPAMPCFSDPQTLNAWLKVRPSEGKYLLIMPPDHPIKCQCKGCAPLYDKKVPYHGEGSRIYTNFVRKAAQKAKQLYPERMVYFVTYYNYTSPPPGLTKLPDNTQAKVCLMYGQNSYSDPKIRHYTDSWLKEWHKITGRKVLAYVYPNWPGAGYTPFPKQYYKTLKAFFKNNSDHIGGMFSDGPNQSGIQAIRGGFYALSLPSTYCLFRLLWNPDFDVDAAVKDMCISMYGKGSGHMHKIITQLNDIWEKKDISKIESVYQLGEYRAGGFTKDHFYQKILTPELVKMFRTELAKAYRAVPKNSAEYRRIDFFGKTLKLFFLDYENFFRQGGNKTRVIPVKEVPFVRDIRKKAALKEWQDIPAYDFVNAYLDHTAKPAVGTKVQIAYDKAGLLYKFTIQEPAKEQVLNKDRFNIWSGDCIETFTEYSPGSTYQVTVNSKEIMRDNFVGRHPGKRRDMPYRYFEHYAKHWVYMLYLPFTTMDAKQRFTPDRKIFFNVSRTRMLKDGSKACSRLNTRFVKEHNNREAFVLLKFEPIQSNIRKK